MMTPGWNIQRDYENDPSTVGNTMTGVFGKIAMAGWVMNEACAKPCKCVRAEEPESSLRLTGKIVCLACDWWLEFQP